MDRSPMELWLKITSLACTDGECTARSLQLVSRQMQDIVRPVRLTSVSLTTKRQLLAFSRLLPTLTQESSSRPPSIPIRHLLLAVPTHHDGDDAKEKEKGLRLQEAICSVLASAAPALQTLTLYGTDLDIVASEVTFPLLEDLCVGRFDSLGRNLPILPSLHRLHLTHYCGWSSFWTLLTQVAPALTHIRLTGLSEDTGLPCILHSLLDLPYQNGLANSISLRLAPPYLPGEFAAAAALSSLRTVIVEPYEYKGGGRCGTGMIMHTQMKCSLEDIAKGCKQGAGRGMLYLLPDIVGYPVSEARLEWLELVEGGSGPWATPEERAARPPPVTARKLNMANRINSSECAQRIMDLYSASPKVVSKVGCVEEDKL